MGIWDFDAFASDDAYDVLGELDDLLAAHPAGAGLRTALRTVRLPCVGYDYDAETGTPSNNRGAGVPERGAGGVGVAR